ncbi:MAG: hypothetical protein ACRDK3_09625 [Actinomycetota bacterium]
MGPALHWLQKRGVLYLLTQAPMIAFIVGYLLGWTSFLVASVASFVVLLLGLPLWVRYRLERTRDPHYPARRAGRFALMALVPVAVYDFVRVPNFYLLDSPYWDRWFDFGHELIGAPPESWAALVAGTLVHYLQGWSLAFGFYVLWPRHVLPGALVYLFGFLTITYVGMFVRYAGSEPTASFVYKVGWDHFWMAVAAWGMAKLVERPTRRPSLAAAPAAYALGAIACLTPFAFAFWQAASAMG